uniref:Protein kinase domain-containing protein n=1 Tax=Cuerna arida TaxID=1464854 RepID=A0A1B6FFU2_9HEMI
MESSYFQKEPAFQKLFSYFGIHTIIIICMVLFVVVAAILWYNNKTSVSDLSLRKKLLSDAKLILSAVLRTHEATDNQLKRINNSETGDDVHKIQGSSNHRQQVPVDPWEIPREKIELGKKLAKGYFGKVYQGVLYNMKGHEKMICAIKTVQKNKSDLDRKSFLEEAEIMKRFKAHHVVELLGVVTKDEPTLIVMELMSKGDLKSYLLAQSVTLREQLQMLIEVADGMAYLSANKFVHRDLAARNCMVAWDNTVKIGDFGMTRDIKKSDYYRIGNNRPLPISWMAPESLKDGVFTSRSDVWSYGVVGWEISALGDHPYKELSLDQVKKNVIAGHVLLMPPENCPDILYNMMKRCWNYEPQMRPTFLQLVKEILELPNFTTNEKFPMVSFYHNRY